MTGFVPSGPVLPAADLRRWCDSRSLLRWARQEADSILGAAKVEAETIRLKAEQEGLRQGTGEAHARAMQCCAVLSERIVQIEKSLPEFALLCMRRICAELDPGVLTQSVVGRMVSDLKEHNQIVIRVSPNRCEDVRAMLKERFADGHVFQLLADTELGDGDCVLETPSAIVDGRLVVQFAALERVLAGGEGG